MKAPVIFFPGFFSTPIEYAPLARELNCDATLFDYRGLTSLKMSDLGPAVCERLEGPCFAIGYSMGGRVLLEAVKNDASKFSRVCFLSTNPGLKTAEERSERLKFDDVWAEKFLNLEWTPLISAWNSQAVFAGPGLQPVREECNFDRQELAENLRNWSLGMQDDHRVMIQSLKIPNLWIAGANDKKFCRFLDELTMMTETFVLPDAGHRIHLDQPRILAKTISEWQKKTAEF